MNFLSKNWEIAETIEDSMYHAHKKDSNDDYMCKIFNKPLLSILKMHREYSKEDYKLSLMTIIDIEYHDGKTFVFFEKMPKLKRFGNFNTKKIIETIIEMARFHYETGYCLSLSFSSDLFVRNNEIYINPVSISHIDFREIDYIDSAKDLFEIFNESRICRKMKYIRENTFLEHKNFENLKIKFMNF